MVIQISLKQVVTKGKIPYICCFFDNIKPLQEEGCWCPITLGFARHQSHYNGSRLRVWRREKKRTPFSPHVPGGFFFQGEGRRNIQSK